MHPLCFSGQRSIPEWQRGSIVCPLGHGWFRYRAANGEVTIHPRVAARVLQNMREENSEDQHLFSDLTERELEVLRLIANGMTNNQIATQLVISENTVKGHVSNILSKLHLADRTQVAVYAWQSGIVKKGQKDK
jgi:two-component system, NarL family, response regulator LiaR